MSAGLEPDEDVEGDQDQRGDDKPSRQHRLVDGGERAGLETVIDRTVASVNVLDRGFELPVAVQEDDGQGEDEGHSDNDGD